MAYNSEPAANRVGLKQGGIKKRNKADMEEKKGFIGNGESSSNEEAAIKFRFPAAEKKNQDNPFESVSTLQQSLTEKHRRNVSQ